MVLDTLCSPPFKSLAELWWLSAKTVHPCHNCGRANEKYEKVKLDFDYCHETKRRCTHLMVRRSQPRMAVSFAVASWLQLWWGLHLPEFTLGRPLRDCVTVTLQFSLGRPLRDSV
ncbi:hypothetical protein EYF80_024314 [Liparis tanakae]|uniref:Uncharacterized protein n=1 Tax=Liparis tanakae TaxID=230148 RepID=A0A4Z2HJQ3_9TELE|nr:hypothetical protein EYF80_024314 [Liparis tanakae]